jgi:hypothetical protein
MADNKIELIYTINYTQPKKMYGKSIKGKSWINFENVINDSERNIIDRTLLTNKYNGMLHNGNDVSFSTSKPEDPEDINTKNIINAYNFLASTNRYEMPSLESIIDELIYAKDDHISKNDASKVETDADAMFIEFMKKIQEPETQTLLRSIGQYQMATDTYGWKLSCDNVIRIKTQNPDATFLQTRRQWFNRFNRKIKPGANRIIVVVPSHNMNDISKADIAKTMEEIGYPPSVSFSDLSTQRRNHIIIMARYHLGRGFTVMPFYDISDTYLIDGKDDKWANESGFDNNLTGHLNPHAMADIENRISNGEHDLKDIYNQEEGNVNLLNDALVRGIENKYPEVKVIKSGNPEIDFEQNLRNLADYLLETKSKMLRKEHRDTAIKIIMGFVYAFSKLNLQKVINGVNNKVLTDEGYLEVRNRINDIIRLINNAMIRREDIFMGSLLESLPYLKSVDQMLNILGVNPDDVHSEKELIGDEMQDITNECITKTNVIENFKIMLKRMNNNSYYNERFN